MSSLPFCGCYYLTSPLLPYSPPSKQYLPLVSSSFHSTILSTTSRTLLTQKFTNPSKNEAITECKYTFPLYDGVSVVSFTCRIGKTVLYGIVKEKKEAKKAFDEAVARGESAGLLEQSYESADVFSTTLGNIPAGESVFVDITYIGELKAAEGDGGVRFTIPTSIAPRYGNGPSSATSLSGNTPVPAQDGEGISIVVDVNMPDGSSIKGVQSPSHPIAVSMGTISTASDADPTMSRASATLSLGTAALEKDFVLVVQAKDVGIPKAILETHPTIPNHRALMATLVPKFSLPPSQPEIVFVADRSGSMGQNITMLASAMKVFLKSMPTGVKFNICSFGSSYSFLWPKSQSYTAETLDKATRHVQTFRADMGGTETFRAIKATIEQRWTDLPLEIMLLTDGDIWQQDELFRYVNEQVEKTKGNIRVFPLGIGNGVSHSLLEGLARAGNGFAQAVQAGERLDNSVVRMLRGALSPHITDYSLEVKYDKGDDDFELIDAVTDGMKVLLSEAQESEKPQKKRTISLFDPTVNPEKDDLKGSEDPLPIIPSPKLLQAPYKIPSLFAFSRTTVYLLMSPETIQRNPTSVILRATSPHGPLALEIPIEVLSSPGETIHQLAAKKATQDLEEGRGWIYDAKDQNGMLIKDRYPSRFADLVKKEAVRIGEKFQVAGKWCSFVAVSTNEKEFAERKAKGLSGQVLADAEVLKDTDADSLVPFDSDDEYEENVADRVLSVPLVSRKPAPMQMSQSVNTPYVPPFRSGMSSASASTREAVFRSGPRPKLARRIEGNRSGIFGRSASGAPPPSEGASPSTSTPVFGTIDYFHSAMLSTSPPPPPPPTGPPAPAAPPCASEGISRSGSPSDSYVLDAMQHDLGLARSADLCFDLQPSHRGRVSDTRADCGEETASFKRTYRDKIASWSSYVPPALDLEDSQLHRSRMQPMMEPSRRAKRSPAWTSRNSPQEKVHALIALQSFLGSWALPDAGEIGQILGIPIGKCRRKGVRADVWITLLVVKYLEIAMSREQGTWGLVVEKARAWLGGVVGTGELEELEGEAGKVVEGVGK